MKDFGKRIMRTKRKTKVKQCLLGIMAFCLIGTSLPGVVLESKAAEEVTVQEEGRDFVHPGMLHTEESFQTMKENIKAQVQPNLDTWNALNNNGFSDSKWNPRPTEIVVRGGTGSNYAGFYIDIRRAYQTALIWKVGGSEAHGEAACRILNAWSEKLTAVTGNADRFLAAGIYGYELANVAEMMREHPSFKQEPMQRLLLDVFYPMTLDFLKNHNGAHIGNYWANWDLCNIASMMAIGIFCDREDIYDQALNYYKKGLGNGSVYNAMPYVYEDGTVQWQEAGRDQGHTTLGISLCGSICEMAWNQGDDLYSLSDNRFLKAAEYVAKYNNGEDVQFSPYEWNKGTNGSSEWQTVVSEAGRGSTRPVYSLVYNHYVNRMGLSAPHIEKILKPSEDTYKLELEQSNGDEFGWQTLTFANSSERVPTKTIRGDFKDGNYRIRSVKTGKSLVINEEGNLASAEKDTMEEEWWKLTNTGDGEYIVTNTITGKAMQVNSDYYTYESVMGTGAKTGALNQRIAFIKNETGDYRLLLSVNRLAVDIYKGLTADDTPIIQYRYHGDEAQRWIIESEVEAGRAADKTALAEALKDAVPETDKEKYTKESFNIYEKALAEAKKVNEDKDAVQAQVDAATKALTDARQALEEKKEPDDLVSDVFDDVNEKDWFTPYIQYVYNNNLMTGITKNIFGPAEILSRAQFATILYRMEGSPKVIYKDIFPDVKDGEFYTEAVMWANEKGIVTGYADQTFGPADMITREQLATMMYRYAGYKGYDISISDDLNDFDDSDQVSAFSQKAVKWAVGSGIISGNEDGTLAPQGEASRAVCAAIIQRFEEKNEKNH